MNNQLELEKCVLGELLLLDDQKQQAHFLYQIRVQYFESKLHQRMFKKVNELCLNNGCCVDQLILAQDCALEEKVKISEFQLGIYSTAYLTHHIEILASKYFQRQLLDKIEYSLKNITASSSRRELEDEQARLITSISKLQPATESDFLDFQKLEQQLQENLAKVKKDAIDGYSWGIRDLDIFTNGIQPSRFYLVAGLKKSGKTRFVIHLIREQYLKDIPIAFLSLEVPEYDLYKMLKGSIMGIEDTKLRSGNLLYLNESEKELLSSTSIDCSKLFIECKGNMSIGEILGRIRRYSGLGAKVIFVDYLQRINLDITNKVNELEAISIHLANISRELDISLVLLSQLSNLAEKQTPSIAHVKGSGGIAESADTILVLDNLSRKSKGKQTKNKFRLELTQRYGESGQLPIYGNLGICKFGNWSNIQQEQQ